MPLRGQDFDRSCSIDHPKSNLIHQNKNDVEATTYDNEVALYVHVCIQKRSACSSLSHLVLQAVEKICSFLLVPPQISFLSAWFVVVLSNMASPDHLLWLPAKRCVLFLSPY